MALSRECPKCQGAMAIGFIVDNSHGSLLVSSWVEGEPTRSFWTGLRLKGRKQVEIKTLCCGRCGFLESYAPPA